MLLWLYYIKNIRFISSRHGSLAGPTRISLKEILPAAIMFLIFILLALALLKSSGYMDLSFAGDISNTIDHGLDTANSGG